MACQEAVACNLPGNGMKNPEYKKKGIKNAGAIKFAKFSSGDMAEMK